MSKDRELPADEFGDNDLLYLIELNTERNLQATRAVAQLLIIPLLGYLIGGAIALLGWLIVSIGELVAGYTILTVGVLVSLIYAIVGLVKANSSLANSK